MKAKVGNEQFIRKFAELSIDFTEENDCEKSIFERIYMKFLSDRHIGKRPLQNKL